MAELRRIFISAWSVMSVFLDSHGDVMIALAGIVAGLGALLGAIAATIAGIHPKYDLIPSGWFVASMACFAGSVGILVLLVSGRLTAAAKANAEKETLAEYMIKGQTLRDKNPTDIPAWVNEFEEWKACVEQWLYGHLDQVAVARFRNDGDLPAAEPFLIGHVDEKTHLPPKLRLIRRLANLQAIMESL